MKTYSTRVMAARHRRIVRRNIRNAVTVIILSLIVLLLFFKISAKPTNAQSKDLENTYKYYTSIYVEQGDTLWSIAEEYMTEEYDSIYEYMDEVKEINHLSTDYLKNGTHLCVPYYSSEYKS